MGPVSLRLPNRLVVKRPRIEIPGVLDASAKAVEGEFDLLNRKNPVGRLYVVEPRVTISQPLTATQAPEGPPGKGPTAIVIQSGQLELGEPMRKGVPPFTVKDISGTFTRSLDSPTAFHFGISAQVEPLGNIVASGRLDPSRQLIEARAVLGNIQIGPELLAFVPPKTRETVESFRPSGQVRAEMQFLGSLRNFRLSVEPVGLSASFKNFPLPVTGITGRIIYDGHTVTLENLTGFTPAGPISVAGKSSKEGTLIIAQGEDMRVDETLVEKFPESLAQLLRRIGLTAGMVDVEFRHVESPAGARDMASVELEGLGAKYADFPYPVSDLTGTVEWDGRDVALQRIKGMTPSGPVALEGTFSHDGSYRLEVQTSRMELAPELVACLPKAVAQVLKDYDVKGHLDCQLYLSGRAKELDAELVADLVDIQATFRGIGISNIKGNLRYKAGRVELSNVSAQCLGGRLRAEGTVELGREGTASLVIEGWGIQVGQQVASILPREAAAVLEESGLRGTTSLSLKLAGPLDKLDVGGVVNLRGATGKYRTIEFSGLQAKLDLGTELGFELSTVANDARVSARGTLNRATKQLSALLDAWGIRLDQRLTPLLPQSIAKAIEDYKATSALNASLNIWGGTDGQPPLQAAGRVELLDAAAVLQGLSVQHTRGALELSGSAVVFSNLRGTVEQAPFILNGTVSKDATELIAEIRQLPISERIATLLPESSRQTLQKLGLTGTVDATAYIRRGTTEATSLDVILNSCQAKTAYVELPLQDICGVLSYDGSALKLKDIRFEAGRARFGVNGSVSPRVSKLILQAGNISLDSTLPRLVPPALVPTLAQIGLKGTLDCKSTLDLSSGPAAALDHSTELALRECSLLFGLPIERLAGKCIVKGGWQDALKTHSGSFALATLTAQNSDLTDLSGDFTYEPGRSFKLERLRATMYGGSFYGDIAVTLRTPVTYSGKLGVRRLDIAELVEERRKGKTDPAHRITGWLDAEIKNITGTGHTTDGINAKDCWLSIGNGDLMHLPLIFNVFEALTLGGVGERSITDCVARFDIRNGIVEFHELAFGGQDVAIAAEGTIDLKGELDLTFVVSKPHGAGLMKLLTLPLDVIKPNLAAVKLTGPFGAPKAKIIPLPPVGRFLRSIESLVKKKKEP